MEQVDPWSAPTPGTRAGTTLASAASARISRGRISPDDEKRRSASTSPPVSRRMSTIVYSFGNITISCLHETGPSTPQGRGAGGGGDGDLSPPLSPLTFSNAARDSPEMISTRQGHPVGTVFTQLTRPRSARRDLATPRVESRSRARSGIHANGPNAKSTPHFSHKGGHRLFPLIFPPDGYRLGIESFGEVGVSRHGDTSSGHEMAIDRARGLPASVGAHKANAGKQP